MIEVRIVVTSRRGIFGWEMTKENLSGVLKTFYVLILVMTTQIYNVKKKQQNRLRNLRGKRGWVGSERLT